MIPIAKPGPELLSAPTLKHPPHLVLAAGRDLQPVFRLVG